MHSTQHRAEDGRARGRQHRAASSHLLRGGHQVGGHLDLLPSPMQQLGSCHEVLGLAAGAGPDNASKQVIVYVEMGGEGAGANVHELVDERHLAPSPCPTQPACTLSHMHRQNTFPPSFPPHSPDVHAIYLDIPALARQLAVVGGVGGRDHWLELAHIPPIIWTGDVGGGGERVTKVS
jgi:hypothetical protein